MRLKLVPAGTKIDFFRFGDVFFYISGGLMVLSVVLFALLGLNYGIDFRGGTMIMAETPERVAVADVRDTLGGLDVGDTTVTEVADSLGNPTNTVLIRIEQTDGEAAAQADVVTGVKAALTDRFAGIVYLQTDSVGGKVSGELVQAGVLAVILAISAVLFYIWLRFEWQFSVGAVAALVHDVVLTIGVFALVGLEFNLSIIAAILTIVGYSLNDTVVVFDRVRENLRRFKKTDLKDVLNMSINETLSRTVMTSVTTLLALFSLYFLGGDVIRGFTFAMIWGVLVGTYSSVFVASTVLLKLGVKRDWDQKPTAAGTQFANIDA